MGGVVNLVKCRNLDAVRATLSYLNALKY